MYSHYYLVIPLVAMISIGLASADVVIDGVKASSGPGSAYQICVMNRSIDITPDKLGADGLTINFLNLRPSSYAFIGERLNFTIAIRDDKSSLDIGEAFLLVNGQRRVICNELEIGKDEKCDGLRKSADGQDAFLDSATDRKFECIYTVEPFIQEERAEISLAFEDSAGILHDSLYREGWSFNPAVSMSIETSDGNLISFERALPGQYAHSQNRLLITNTARSVSLWVFIASTDFFDHYTPAKCPVSNKIDVEGNPADPLDGLYYRAKLGTMVTRLTGMAGDNPVEGWAHMTNPNQNLECSLNSVLLQGFCSGARPLFTNNFLSSAGGLTGWANNALYPLSTAEVEFKMKFPRFCIGSFDTAIIWAFGKPV